MVRVCYVYHIYKELHIAKHKYVKSCKDFLSGHLHSNSEILQIIHAEIRRLPNVISSTELDMALLHKEEQPNGRQIEGKLRILRLIKDQRTRKQGSKGTAKKL